MSRSRHMAEHRHLVVIVAALLGGITGAGFYRWLDRDRPLKIVVVEAGNQSTGRARDDQDWEPLGDPAPAQFRPAQSRVLPGPDPSATPARENPNLEKSAPGNAENVDQGAATSRPYIFNATQTVILNRGLPNLGIPKHTPAQAVSSGTIDDALSYALEAASPYLKEGFTLREDYWGGDLPLQEPKAVVHQLFKGNEYWFWIGANDPKARISLHIYDSGGKLVDIEYLRNHKGAIRVVPKQTGSYAIVLNVETASEERTFWAMAYGFR